MKWKMLSKRTVFSQPPWLVVEQHAVQLPGGRVIPDWPWVITPNYVNVLAQGEDGRFLCFRQEKYGLPESTLAVVGGYINPGEVPLEAARRELLEELGCEAAEWIPLGSFLMDPNRGIANGHLYLARGARRIAEPTADDLEEQTLIYLDRAGLESALRRGEIKVLAWAATVIFALQALDQSDS